jgi:hypothetical protein
MRVSVKCTPLDGRGRAGFRFTREARVIEVTDEQLRALEGDSLLSVTMVEDEAPISPEPERPVERKPPVDTSDAVHPDPRHRNKAKS